MLSVSIVLKCSMLCVGPSVYSTRPCAKPTGSVDAPLRSIKEVVFGVLSPEEIVSFIGSLSIQSNAMQL